MLARILSRATSRSNHFASHTSRRLFTASAPTVSKAAPTNNNLEFNLELGDNLATKGLDDILGTTTVEKAKPKRTRKPKSADGTIPKVEIGTKEVKPKKAKAAKEAKPKKVKPYDPYADGYIPGRTSGHKRAIRRKWKQLYDKVCIEPILVSGNDLDVVIQHLERGENVIFEQDLEGDIEKSDPEGENTLFLEDVEVNNEGDKIGEVKSVVASELFCTLPQKSKPRKRSKSPPAKKNRSAKSQLFRCHCLFHNVI